MCIYIDRALAGSLRHTSYGMISITEAARDSVSFGSGSIEEIPCDESIIRQREKIRAWNWPCASWRIDAAFGSTQIVQ